MSPVSKKKDGKPFGVKRAGWGWHSDGEDKRVRNMSSMLFGIKTPEVGGDTGFISTNRVYDASPKNRRTSRYKARENQPGRNAPSQLSDATAAYRSRKRDRPDVWHPVVRTRPEYQRKKYLYVRRWAVESREFSAMKIAI